MERASEAWWRRHPWAMRLAAVAVSAWLAVLPQWLTPSEIASIEDRVGDLFWQFGASDPDKSERRVVLVDIDERSLRDVGAWPWARPVTAELIARIHAAGAAVQALDIVLAEVRDGDDRLAAALTQASPVVAELFSLDPDVSPRIGVVGGGGPHGDCGPLAARAYGHYGLAPSLPADRLAFGHITPQLDADGVVRHLPALVCYDTRAHMTLALAALWRMSQPASLPAASTPRRAAGASGSPPPWTVDEHVAGDGWAQRLGWRPRARLTLSGAQGLQLPLDALGRVRVPYRLARDAFVSVSAADVLAGQPSVLALLRGSVVLVGSTAFGTGDSVSTPLNAVASGLEVHAQLLVGVLDARVPFTPLAWSGLQVVLGVLAAGLLLVSATAGSGAPAKRLPLMGVVLAAGTAVAAMAALNLHALWLPWFSLALFCMLASLSLTTVEHALVRAQRERLSAHLGAYLPPAVAERLMASDPTGRLQFEPSRVTVLVSRVRNFAALATLAEPGETAALLHAYCCTAVDVVERHGGIVEQVVGDAITATWSAGDGPPAASERVGQAVAAAKELLLATGTVFASQRPVHESGPLQPLALGVGLETGTALVGSYGPARRRAHAVLGEPVTVATAVQRMTAELSVPIVLGPQLASMLPAESLEPMGDYLLEGVSRSLSLSTVRGWPALVATDRRWASSVTTVETAGEPGVDADWSRWTPPPAAAPRVSVPQQAGASSSSGRA